jgi:hypothetical protein
MRTPPRASPQSHRTVLTGFIRRRACKRDVLETLDENAFLLCKKEQSADLLSHDEIARLTSSPRLARCRCPTCTASTSFKYSDHVESYRIRPIKPSLSNQLDQFEFTNSCEERTSQLLAVTCIPTHRATRATMRWPERHLAGGLLDGEPASGGYKHQSMTMKTCRQVQHRPSPPDIGAVIDMAEPARSNHESDSSDGSDQRRDCKQRTRQQSARHPRPLQKSRYQSRSSWFTRSSDEESETHTEIEHNAFCREEQKHRTSQLSRSHSNDATVCHREDRPVCH